LPDNASLEHLRNQARTLQRAVRSGDRDALERVTQTGYAVDQLSEFPLSLAQLVIAREYGFASWPRLKHHLDVIGEYRWDADIEARATSPADEFCLLACLNYADDSPKRRAEARQLLTEHPDLMAGHIWAAAAAADRSAVQRLVSADPAAAGRRGGPNRWQPLFYLAYSRLQTSAQDALATARILLDAGADPNEGYLWGGLPTPFTLLTGVFGEGEQGAENQPRHPHSLALARLLLDAGADPNDGQALYNRMFGPDNDHLELLFEYGLGRGDGGPWKARMGDALEAPADLVRGQLRWAVRHGMTERVALLVANGADISTPFADGQTPVAAARVSGHQNVAEYLVAQGASAPELRAVDEFIAAALQADRSTVDRLGPGVAAAARQERPGLVVWAAACGRIEAIRLLVERGFDVNALARADVPVERPWETALHAAVSRDDLVMAQALLELGADPNISDARFDATPLGWARYFDRPQLVELLEPLSTD
jgi:ankyrin repeat protein